MDWIIHPLTQYALMAVSLVLCLTLFISLKRETSALRRQLREEHEMVSAALDSFRSSLGSLQASLNEHEAALAASPQSPPSTLSMNLTKRSQALRMHRRGEKPEQIAATLQIPRSEVELLLKVHHSIVEQA
jgi:DNA-binding NarL/FixJ family response regulator